MRGALPAYVVGRLSISIGILDLRWERFEEEETLEERIC